MLLKPIMSPLHAAFQKLPIDIFRLGIELPSANFLDEKWI